MVTERHPIRDLPIISYAGDTDAVAFIGDGSRFSYPYFRAADRQAAEANAEAFRQDVLDKHEATFIARQEGAEKARMARLRKVKP